MSLLRRSCRSRPSVLRRRVHALHGPLSPPPSHPAPPPASPSAPGVQPAHHRMSAVREKSAQRRGAERAKRGSEWVSRAAERVDRHGYGLLRHARAAEAVRRGVVRPPRPRCRHQESVVSTGRACRACRDASWWPLKSHPPAPEPSSSTSAMALRRRTRHLAGLAPLRADRWAGRRRI